MGLKFCAVAVAEAFKCVEISQWQSWAWQMRETLSSREDFEKVFDLSQSETEGFKAAAGKFKIAATPYYASLVAQSGPSLRPIIMPSPREALPGEQQMLDPLAEVEHSPTARLIHRYSDRVIFLVTDLCSVYCRFCTRKRFTGSDQGLVSSKEYAEAINYIKKHPGVREVIFSGGDPLTLSNAVLKRVLSDVRAIEHVEIIRIGTRMPVVCPMRVDKELCEILRSFAPVFVMTHFSHPKELTKEAAQALSLFVDHGVPVFNQMVLLNGVNNSPAIIQALNRRLLYLRAKPYYMFQCDPSEGTDHLRTTVEESEEIMQNLWGHLSGLAMPSLILDIPDGGGKALLAPDFEVGTSPGVREYKGWDGRRGVYKNPTGPSVKPADESEYLGEWEVVKNAKI